MRKSTALAEIPSFISISLLEKPQSFRQTISKESCFREKEDVPKQMEDHLRRWKEDDMELVAEMVRVLDGRNNTE